MLLGLSIQIQIILLCFLPRNYSQMFSIYLSMALMCILLPLTATNVSYLSQFWGCTSISGMLLLPSLHPQVASLLNP